MLALFVALHWETDFVIKSSNTECLYLFYGGFFLFFGHTFNKQLLEELVLDAGN